MNPLFLLLLILTSALIIAYGVTFNCVSYAVFGYFLMIDVTIYTVYNDFKNIHKRCLGE